MEEEREQEQEREPPPPPGNDDQDDEHVSEEEEEDPHAPQQILVDDNDSDEDDEGDEDLLGKKKNGKINANTLKKLSCFLAPENWEEQRLHIYIEGDVHNEARVPSSDESEGDEEEQPEDAERFDPTLPSQHSVRR